MGKSVMIGIIPKDNWKTAKELLEMANYDYDHLQTIKVILGNYYKKGKVERRIKDFGENFTGHSQYEYRLKQVAQNTETL